MAVSAVIALLAVILRQLAGNHLVRTEGRRHRGLFAPLLGLTNIIKTAFMTFDKFR